MFASCLHFWDKMQVPGDVQAETSHWLAAVAVVQIKGGARQGDMCWWWGTASPVLETEICWSHFPPPFTHPKACIT